MEDKMKYYKLILETDTDKIGNVDGIQSDIVGYGDRQSELLMNKNLYESIKIDEIKSLTIDEKAIITDVISTGTLSLTGFIVNERFKKVIAKYTLSDIQFIEATFFNKPDIKGYYFMFFNSDLTNNIDYSLTKFGVKENSFFSNKVTTSELESSQNNLKSIIELDKEYAGSIKKAVVPVDKYVFKESISSDVFRIGHFDLSFYFSERVKREIESNEFTGFYFVETERFN
jgi:hypothetical protein